MPPDILDDLAAARKTNGPMCWLGRLRVESPELAEAYDRAIGDPRIFSADDIATWFTQRGYPVSGITVQRHRNGQCVKCKTTS